MGYDLAVCGPAVQRDRGLSVPHFAVEVSRDISPAADLQAVRRVGAVFRTFRPDLIHAHGSQAGVIARLARAALPSVPLIHTPHQYAFVNYFAGPRRQTAYRLIERTMAPLATRVLCVCEAERRLAVEIGAGRQARVVYNGIEPLDPSPIPSELSWLSGQPGPLVAAVAELHERKGLVSLIEAMPDIRARFPDVRLVIAGEGPERGRLQSRRDELGLAEAVFLPGHISGVPGLLTAADVFVNPAWAEAFPYAVLEAMSLARPCVVTDVGGTAEAIVDGQSGMVVPPGAAAPLATAICRLLGDEGEATRFGEAAKHRLLQRFTRAQMLEGTMAVYGEVGLELPD